MKWLLTIVLVLTFNVHAADQPHPCQRIADHLNGESMSSCPAGEACISFSVNVAYLEGIPRCAIPSRMDALPAGFRRRLVTLKGVRADDTDEILDAHIAIWPVSSAVDPTGVSFGYAMDYANVDEALLQFDHLLLSFETDDGTLEGRIRFSEVTYVGPSRMECPEGVCDCPAGEVWSAGAEACVDDAVCDEFPAICAGPGGPAGTPVYPSHEEDERPEDFGIYRMYIEPYDHTDDDNSPDDPSDGGGSGGGGCQLNPLAVAHGLWLGWLAMLGLVLAGLRRKL